MIFKNKEIIELSRSIDTLSKQKIPVGLAWKILKIKNKINPFLQEYVLKSIEIKKSCSLRDANGAIIVTRDKKGNETPMIDSTKAKKMGEEIMATLEEEKEVDIDLISLDDFKDMEISVEFLKFFEKTIKD